MNVIIAITTVVVLIYLKDNTVTGCTTNAQCPKDQCCSVDLHGVFGHLCQAYSQEGEGCHGSLFGSSCDCLPGLGCVEYTGVLGILHTSRGVCRKPTAASLVG